MCQQIGSESCKSTFGGMTRFVVLVLSTLCLSLVIANSLALNFTVICMEREGGDNGTAGLANLTAVPMFSAEQQSWLFSAIAIGQLLGSLPISLLTTRFGLREMFTAFGLASSLSTLFLPTSIYIGGFPTLFAIRIVQGAAVATIWVVTGAISAQWSPLANSGLFLAVLSCNLQFGPVLAMPLAAQLCSSPGWGWSPVYHLLGSISAAAFCLFFFFFRDSPRKQRNVSRQELAIIEEGKLLCSLESQKANKKVPWRAILCDRVFWDIFTSTAAANLGFQIFWQYGPLYLNKTLGIEVGQTGLAAALPFLLSAIVKLFAGPISDRLNCVSEKGRVIFFASVSQYLMGSCFLALALLPKVGLATRPVMQLCFTAGTVFSGLNAVGIVKSTQLVSRQFSHVIFSWCTLMLSLVMLALPLIVNSLAPNNSPEEWSHIFLFITAAVVAGTTFFNLTAEVQPRPWTGQPSAKVKECKPAKRGIFFTEVNGQKSQTS